MTEAEWPAGRGTGGFSWLQVGIPAALCVICVAVFSQSLRAGFVLWDDDTEILANPHVKELSWESLKWAFTNYEWTRRYQPLDWVSWQINYRLGGLDAWGYHVGNLLEHLLCVVLLYLVVVRVLRAWWKGLAGEGGGRLVYWAAGLGTLWWAIHPLRAEPVAWVTGRIYTQCTMFLLASVWTYLVAQDEPSRRGRRGLWLGASAVLFGCSLLSYAIVVGAAFAFVLLDVYPLRRVGPWSGFPWWSRQTGRVVLEKVPYFGAALIVGLVTLWARFHTTAMWAPPKTLAEFSLASRIMQAFYTWAYYLVAPWAPFHLSPVYTRLLHFAPGEPVFLGSVMLVVGLSVAAWKFRSTFPGAALAWVYHLVILVPLLGLTEHPHYTNDRYAQLEELFVPLVLGGAYLLVMQRVKQGSVKAGVNAIAAVLLTSLAVLCYAQTTVWLDSGTLFSHMITELEDDPYRADIQWRLGRFYMEQNRLSEAVPLIEASLATDGNNKAALHLAGVTYRKLGDQTEGYLPRTNGRGEMYLKSGQMFDREAMQSHDVRALRSAGVSYALAGRLDVAEERLGAALQVQAVDPATRLALAQVYHDEHKQAEAMEQLKIAVTQDGSFAGARDAMEAQWKAQVAGTPATGQAR